jgi:AAA+ ATPase superfamily predicted ATPase
MISYIKNGHNITLVSERRMGKTGLIEHVFHDKEIKNDYYTFLVDINSAGSIREFVFLLGKHIFDTLKPRGLRLLEKFFATVPSLRLALKYDPINGAPEFNIGLGEIRQPETSLEQIFRYLESANKRCIVAIDEFQQVASFPEKNMEAILRTIIQRCSNTHFIFAGSIHHMMHEIFFTYSRPFYQSVTPMFIGAIDKDKYVEFASRFFAEAKIGVTDDVIGYVYDWFEGHTWYMQRVFNEIYIQTPAGGRVDLESVYNAVRSIAHAFELTYHNIMSHLTERQKEVLIAIAKEPGKAPEITSTEFIRKNGLMSPSSVQSSVRLLANKQIVGKEQKSYFIFDRFFKIWLNMIYGSGIGAKI